MKPQAPNGPASRPRSRKRMDKRPSQRKRIATASGSDSGKLKTPAKIEEQQVVFSAVADLLLSLFKGPFVRTDEDSVQCAADGTVISAAPLDTSVAPESSLPPVPGN